MIHIPVSAEGSSPAARLRSAEEKFAGGEAARKLDGLFETVADFTGLMDSLRKAFTEIDQASPPEREPLKNRAVEKLAALSADLLRDLFENPLPGGLEGAGLREAVVNKMTAEKLQGVFSEAGQWYGIIRRNASSEFEVVERVNQLKNFLGQLLASPARGKVPLAIYEELLKNKLIPSVPEGVRRFPEEDALACRVERMMEDSAAALLEGGARNDLPAVFGRLCAANLFDATRELLVKFMENFSQESSRLRRLAVAVGRNLLEVLWRSGRPTLGDRLYEAIRRLADAERSGEVYGEIAETLSLTAERFLLEGKEVQALEAVTLLRRHREESDPFLPVRGETAARALENIARRTMDVLAEEMASPDPARSVDARNVVNALGAAAAPCLVEAIRRAPDLRARRSAALALKESGETAVQALAARLSPDLSSPEILNLLSVAEEFPSISFAPSLKGLGLHPDPLVRIRVVRLLGRSGLDEGRETLTDFLEDEEESVRRETVRVLGEARYGATALTKMLPGENEAVEEEVFLALGKIADDAVVAPLMEALTRRPRPFFGRSRKEEMRRVRAALALANVKTPLGRETLRKFMEDRNSQVRRIARQAEETPNREKTDDSSYKKQFQ